MDAVLLDRDGDGVAVVTLNRPRTLNAISLELTDALHAALDELAGDGSVSVVILTGAGAGFCSGHDFGEFDQTAASVEASVAIQERMSSLVLRLKSLPQPVIAAVNGAAAGGGLALAVGCDIRICAATARFNAAFIRVGLLGTDMGLSFLLPRVVGLSAAAELMLTGRFVSAAESRELGLVSAVVSDGSVVDAAREMARSMIPNGRLALQLTKRVLWANLEAGSLASAMETENHGQVVLLHTPEHRAHVAAWHRARAARGRP